MEDVALLTENFDTLHDDDNDESIDFSDTEDEINLADTANLDER